MTLAIPKHGSPAKWKDNNVENMKLAKVLSSRMLKQVRVNEAIERASKNAAMEQAVREKQQIRDSVFAKAADHMGVISTSFTCMREIEDGILQTDNSLALLRQNRALAFAALQVCKRRTTLRNRRPEPELVKDKVTTALEEEQRLLEEAREEFFQLEEKGTVISKDLAKMRAELSADTGSRRLLMVQDQHELRPHLAPPADKRREHPEINEKDSEKRLKDTFRLLHRSNKYREESLDFVERIKSESRAAFSKTEECLEKRTEELTAVKKKLEAHMNEADQAISVSERSLDRSEKRADPKDVEKKDKLDNDRALLRELKAHKAKLQEEIQNKFLALEIDNHCRRVTPIKACEPSLLDAQNAQNAQMGQRGRPAGQLNSSASAPSLVGTNSAGAGGTKLPNLGGTSESFGREKLRSSASNGSMSSTSSTMSGARAKR